MQLILIEVNQMYSKGKYKVLQESYNNIKQYIKKALTDELGLNQKPTLTRNHSTVKHKPVMTACQVHTPHF